MHEGKLMHGGILMSERDAPPPEAGTPKPPSREERLAAKLRENLKKRKDQARQQGARDDAVKP